jgi:hypothetical protein
MLMLEKNNLDIAGVVERWLRESVERSEARGATETIFPNHAALGAGVQPVHR